MRARNFPPETGIFSQRPETSRILFQDCSTFMNKSCLEISIDYNQIFYIQHYLDYKKRIPSQKLWRHTALGNFHINIVLQKQRAGTQVDLYFQLNICGTNNFIFFKKNIVVRALVMTTVKLYFKNKYLVYQLIVGLTQEEILIMYSRGICWFFINKNPLTLLAELATSTTILTFYSFLR